MKVISPRMHGMLDYGTIALFALAPRFLTLMAPTLRLATYWPPATCSSR
ncbi:hypothetical protein MUN84_08725 [Hymenobacter sp. 5516J-16]|nr:hypothetical protein [Hymenobacter sp. 5516J-16]UOQ78606.1 hypothetical protein MUN84_08725 [Hymenobacter sp. 5516J-16]